MQYRSRGLLEAVLYGFLALLFAAGCSESHDAATAEDGNGSTDGATAGNPAIDHGIEDAGAEVADPEGGTAADSGLDPSEDAGLRQFKPGADAGGGSDGSSEAADGLFVSGTVSHDGACRSGAQVCASYSVFTGPVSSQTFTDENGAFEVTDLDFSLYEFQSGIGPITVTPRKAGCVYDPKDVKVDVETAKQGISGLVFTARSVEVPLQATGRWKVIYEICGESEGPFDEVQDAGTAPDPGETEPSYCGMVLSTGEIGETYTFEDGCIWDGIGCAEGRQYSDLEARCLTMRNEIGLYLSPIMSEGEFDEATGRWRIVRKVSYAMMGSIGSSSKTVVLERVP